MAKAALVLMLMLCCASLALATYDTYKPKHECSCDEDCYSKNSQCTTYKCKHGKCVAYNKDDGCSCDDGNACTYGDKCYHGKCKGSPVKCYSKDQCKFAYCNPHSGKCEAKYKPDGTSCKDGNKCTYKDTCYAGVCKSGYWKKCANKSPCTKSYCHPVTGQCKTVPTNEGGHCDDGNPKTYKDKCCQGVCKGTYKSYHKPPSHKRPHKRHSHDPHHG